MRVRLEPRGRHPALDDAGPHDPRGRRRARDRRAHPVVRRGRSGPLLPAHPRCRVRKRRGHQRHAGQGDAADPHRARLFHRVPDAPLEHRRRGPVPARRVGRQRDRARPGPAGRHPGHRHDPGDDARGRRRRGAVGPDPGRAEGEARGQRDHHHADAQLHRPGLGPVLGLRAVERIRLPGDRPVPARPRTCRG